MNGREKCELINQIRQKIADNNNIDFVIYDCTFDGECTGRCAKSDSELNYLERELEKRQNEGVKLNINGVFALDIEDKTIETQQDKSIKRQEKLEKLMENPELSDLPPRYMDMLL
ncbi:hypothetical protein [Methanobrevibacter sp.]|uniref:hypothetical protein n=1 Tax=Methanobrevibacter sp. TaxID=66852 RepID=UPI0025FF3451|nr:hypothetical protein [Methanobrevibacter sp.]